MCLPLDYNKDIFQLYHNLYNYHYLNNKFSNLANIIYIKDHLNNNHLCKINYNCVKYYLYKDRGQSDYIKCKIYHKLGIPNNLNYREDNKFLKYSNLNRI